MEDQELLRRFRGGDAGALEALVTRHEASLLRYAHRLTGDRELAQDVVQEALLALLRGSGRGGDPDSPGAWLFRVTRNRAMDAMKRETRMRERQQSVAIPEATVPGPPAIEESERNRALTERFAALDADVQEVLSLKIHEQKTYREIGTITGFSLGKISTLVHRGLTELSSALKAAGVV